MIKKKFRRLKKLKKVTETRIKFRKEVNKLVDKEL